MIIGICDDCPEDRDRAERICRNTLQQHLADCTILQFENGEELWNNQKELDVLILDIEMPQMSGIEVKNCLQNYGIHTMVIFVTGHEEMMSSAFGINVFGFVKKRTMEQQLSLMLESLVHLYNNSISIDGINSDDIIYIKSSHVYSEMILANGNKKLIRSSLNELEKRLRVAYFIRVHRSYLVNARWITRFGVRGVSIKYPESKEFGNEPTTELPVSQRMQKKAKSFFANYCKEHGRFC